MKTTLALIALFAVALPAGAALVETFGYAVPSYVSLETGRGLFVAAFALLLFGAAYSEPRTAEGSHRAPVRLLPAAEAFAPAPAHRIISRTRRIRESVTASC